MFTYQDLLSVGESDIAKQEFCVKAIENHRTSSAYRVARDAEDYYAKKNVTIGKYQKFLRTVTGRQVPDTFSSNYKIKTLFFRRFVTQQVQYVLSNGVTFEKDDTADKLGRSFDNRIQTAAKRAMVDGVSFLFWNFDHVEVFGFADTPASPGFVPLYDERTSQLMAGIRYWFTGEKNKITTHFTLYELDGFTEYVRVKNGKSEVVSPKRGYVVTKQSSKADGEEVIAYENYESFPIVPMYANDLHESELIGIRESIDCYDFIKSGLANEIDDTSGFYWVVKNSGGMDDIDLAQFIERMKNVRAAAVDGDDGASAEAHTFDIPVEARTKMLEILKQDMYEDFQLLNVYNISAGNKTATEIRASYQPQDDKCGAFEFEITSAIMEILRLAGIDDTPLYKWNRIANQTEETNMVMSASAVLDDETILRHLPWLMPEEVDDVMKRKDDTDIGRFGIQKRENNKTGKEPEEAEEE